MDNDQTSLLAHFIELCRCDANQAQFYLESNNFDLDASVAAYFADQEEEENEVGDPSISASAQTFGSEKSSQVSSNNSRVQMPKSSDRITTLASLGARISDDEQSGDEGQSFYVGGSEQGGGQEVIGPRKKKDPKEKGASNIIKNVFQAAKDHGAEEVSADGQSQTSTKDTKSVFSGSGYRLGESTTESSVFLPGQGISESERPRQVPMVLKMWENGFSIDDGPLREYNDPANREFLASISRGEIPQELLQLARGGEVELNMEDHRHEEFKIPLKPKLHVFSGTGFQLGSPAPRIVTNNPETPSVSAPSAAMSSPIVLDESQPTTQLQIRLGDGTRMVVKMNHSHTIGHIRQHILSQRPDLASRTFILMTTFPSKSLTDESKSLSEEKLLNAAVVQKFT